MNTQKKYFLVINLSRPIERGNGLPPTDAIMQYVCAENIDKAKQFAFTHFNAKLEKQKELARVKTISGYLSTRENVPINKIIVANM